MPQPLLPLSSAIAPRAASPCSWRAGAILSLTVLVAGLVPGAAQATGNWPPLESESLPTSTGFSIESVRLPQGERMGLMGASMLFAPSPSWRVGPAVYGAFTGHRGGLFVGGVQVEHGWPISDSQAIVASVFAGGGGGGAAPVGSGLMLRPSVKWLTQLSPTVEAGIAWSQVRFPSGDIHSNQLGLVIDWYGEYRHYGDAAPGDIAFTRGASGIGFDRLAITASQYRLAGGRHIALVGARADRLSTGDGLVFGVETAAAASGNAAGYMEILGDATASAAPFPEALPSWRTGVRAAIGLGGGGAVPTGGGVIGKFSAVTEISPHPGWAMGAGLGIVRTPSHLLRAKQLDVWMRVDLEGQSQAAPVVRTEWTAVIQHHGRVARNDGSFRALDTVGIKLDRYVSQHVYLTGQAHSAYAGGAGAYSMGLLGAGLASSQVGPARAGLEVLAGAAGGGGVQTGGGALTQWMGWLGVSPSRHGGEWRLGLGQQRTVRSGFTSPVAELSWTKTFMLSSR